MGAPDQGCGDHAAKPGEPLNGGPQMVEVSRDGRRIYVTNGLYSPWDEQFYPDGVRGWMAKINVGADGRMEVDKGFFLQSEDMSRFRAGRVILLPPRAGIP